MIIRNFCVFNFNALLPFHKQVENKVLGLKCLKHVVDNMVCGSFISNGNRTEWSPIRSSCNHTSD